ncbi:hypothetical protein [Streptomyces sp. NBC_00996]|uniref:hypothetical protein n=1 Tax=Streptomyces sp. NBC_00996 TaxID=2903710 RepID=UPI003869DDAD|nr:hypothetical protein OG390_15405 [Streptomyces sp. NBC_00996]
MSNGAVGAGVFVAALVLLFVSVAQGWTVLAWLCGAVLIGVMVTNAARRQQSGGQTPQNSERPWRRRSR